MEAEMQTQWLNSHKFTRNVQELNTHFFPRLVHTPGFSLHLIEIWDPEMHD